MPNYCDFREIPIRHPRFGAGRRNIAMSLSVVLPVGRGRAVVAVGGGGIGVTAAGFLKP